MKMKRHIVTFPFAGGAVINDRRFPLGAARLFCCLALFCGLMNAPALSQADSSRRGWLSFGFGAAGGSTFDGPAGLLSVSYRSEIGLLRARLLNTGPLLSNLTATGAVNDIIELGATYGLVYESSPVMLSASAGAAVLWIDTQRERGAERTVTLGIPVIVDAWYVPFRFFGIGASAYGTVNTTATYGGFAVCLGFGKLR